VLSKHCDDTDCETVCPTIGGYAGGAALISEFVKKRLGGFCSRAKKQCCTFVKNINFFIVF
jgi:hypothetical protein